MIGRRTFIKGASMAAITASASGINVTQSHAQQVPNSAGTEQPKGLTTPIPVTTTRSRFRMGGEFT